MKPAPVIETVLERLHQYPNATYSVDENSLTV
jgi:hypothetical protein